MLIAAPRRILVAREPVDFRRQINGLAAVVECVLEEPPLDGTLFCFTNKRKDAMKMLMWTHGGFLLMHKKLERGRFRWPTLEADRAPMTVAELSALLEGIDLSRCRRLSRWNPENPSASMKRKG